MAAQMRGPLMVDVAGTSLTGDDIKFLQNPEIGGIVLFARNYSHPQQLRALCDEIHGLSSVPLKIAVDQEGGRVQRFVDGFTRIPPMASIGELIDSRSLAVAQEMARAAGLVIASELRAVGVDLSFAPVLDLAVADNLAIGSRAFTRAPEHVSVLALAVAGGLNAAGMPAVGKHFPGHGSIRADTHAELPSDGRDLQQVLARDLVPFSNWAAHRAGGLMTAHIRFPQICSEPVTFSRYWLHEILRLQLAFDGVIFSDDLGMAAARHFGSIEVATESALRAGCDVVLVCNDRQAAAAAMKHIRRNKTSLQWDAAQRQRVNVFWEAAAQSPAGVDEAVSLISAL